MTYEAERGALQLVLTGDALVQRPLAQYREPRFLALRDLLLSADAAVTQVSSAAPIKRTNQVICDNPYGCARINEPPS